MDDPFDMTPPTGMYSLEVLNAALMRISSQRSEEHTSELQSQSNLVCRLLLEKKQPMNHCPSASLSAHDLDGMPTPQQDKARHLAEHFHAPIRPYYEQLARIHPLLAPHPPPAY